MKKAIAVFVALLLVGILAVGVSAQSGSGGFFDFESSVRIMQDLLVLDDVNIQDSLRVEGAMSTGGVLTVTGDLISGDDLTVPDQAVVGKIRYTRGTTQTLTADATITDTWTYLGITAAGAIGTSGIASATSVAGDVLVLTNVGSNAIVITDTGNTVLSGNITLGQFDTLGLVFDGVRWVQLYTTNN